MAASVSYTTEWDLLLFMSGNVATLSGKNDVSKLGSTTYIVYYLVVNHPQLFLI